MALKNKTNRFPQKCIIKLIEIYKDSPCLWNMDAHEEYRDHDLRLKSIKKLTALAQQYDCEISTTDVMKKIESLRSCYRHECRKIEAAQKENREYTPRLWYYNLMTFLPINPKFRNQYRRERSSDNDPESEISYSDDAGVEAKYFDFEVYNEGEQSTGGAAGSSSVEAGTKRSQVTDEYDAIGVNVAAKLRHLPATSRIYAEKLINEVLFHAQMNTLSQNTTINILDPFKVDRLS